MDLLNETALEVDRLLEAGARLAKGDYRIARILPSLAGAASGAPVLGRVAEALSRATVADAEPLSSASALLEARALVFAVMKVQAESRKALSSEPIESLGDRNIPTLTYRTLAPVVSALTEKGAGRLKVVEEAEKQGQLGDFRLIPALVVALGDSYDGISSLAERALSRHGKRVSGLLLGGIRGSPKDWLRIGLLVASGSLDAKTLTDLSIDADISQRGREEAVRALASFPEAYDFLIGLSGGRNKGVAATAAEALCSFDGREIAETLERYVGSTEDPGALRPALRDSSSEHLRSWVVKGALSRIAALADPEPFKVLGNKERKKLLAETVFFLGAAGYENRGRKDVVDAFMRALGGLEASGLIHDAKDGGLVIRECLKALFGDTIKEDAKAFFSWERAMSPDFLPLAFELSLETETHPQCYGRFSPVIDLRPDDPARMAFVETVRRLLLPSYDSREKRITPSLSFTWNAGWKDKLASSGCLALATGFVIEDGDKTVLKALEKGDLRDPDVAEAFERSLARLCELDRPNIVPRIAEFLTEAKKGKGAQKLRALRYDVREAIGSLPYKRMKDVITAILREDQAGDADVAEILRFGQQRLEERKKES